eukprot:jgi/Botrbrau1/8884/Bobra.0148s0004.1
MPRSRSRQSTSQVLFCGRDFHFGYQYTAEALANDEGVEIVLHRLFRLERLADSFASKLLAVIVLILLDHPNLLKLYRTSQPAVRTDPGRRPHLRLILQYGVGVEGVDIPAATEQGIWVSNIPSHGTGNALSCAEMALYLMLATLRKTKLMEASIHNRIVGVPIGETLFGKNCPAAGVWWHRTCPCTSVRLVPPTEKRSGKNDMRVICVERKLEEIESVCPQYVRNTNM